VLTRKKTVPEKDEPEKDELDHFFITGHFANGWEILFFRLMKNK